MTDEDTILLAIESLAADVKALEAAIARLQGLLAQVAASLGITP